MKWGNVLHHYLCCYINCCILYNEEADEKPKEKPNQTVAILDTGASFRWLVWWNHWLAPATLMKCINIYMLSGTQTLTFKKIQYSFLLPLSICNPTLVTKHVPICHLYHQPNSKVKDRMVCSSANIIYLYWCPCFPRCTVQKKQVVV